MQSIFDALYSPFTPSGAVIVMDDILTDLQFWLRVLQDPESIW